MGEVFEIEQNIQKNKENLIKLDETISWSNKKEDIIKFSEGLKTIFDDIQKIQKEIKKIKNKDEQDKINNQLNDLEKDIADLRDDWDINQSNILATEEQIKKETQELEQFINGYIKTIKNKISITIWTEYNTPSETHTEIREKTRKISRKSEGNFENWMKIENMRTPNLHLGESNVAFKITDTQTVEAIENETLKILQHPDIKIEKYKDESGKIYYKIYINGITFEELEQLWYMDYTENISLTEDNDTDDIIYKKEQLNGKKAWEDAINIIVNSKETAEKKYEEIKEIGNNLQTSEEKITYLWVISLYFSSIYDYQLFEEKKNITKDFRKEKKTSDEDLLMKDKAGVCADHHRFLAMMAEDMWMNAWIMSITSWWLHAITWIKNEEDYILIDYGAIYTSKDPEDLVASYYANKWSTPKPFDIVTDSSGNIIWTITTRLWETIGKRISPYENIDSWQVAVEKSKQWMEPIQQGEEYKTTATNKTQDITMIHGTNNEKYELLAKITNIEDVDNASTTGIQVGIRKLSESQQSETSINIAYNNIRRENENEANNIWLWFWYAYRFNTRNIGNVWIHQAVVGQLGVWFDTNKDNIWERDYKGEYIWVMNWETPAFIGSVGYAASTDNIQLNNNISTQGYGSIEGKILPNKIDSPVNTMTIKPKAEIGINTNIKIWPNTNFGIWWKTSVTQYNTWTNEIGYGINANISTKNLNIYGNIEGKNHTISKETILAKRFIREFGAQRNPQNNILGNNVSVFWNIKGTNINGNNTGIQTNIGMKYNF